MTKNVSNLVFLNNLDELYIISISEYDNNIKYRNTTIDNLKNTQKNYFPMTSLQPINSSVLFDFKSFIDCDLFDLDNFFVQENSCQNQAL